MLRKYGLYLAWLIATLGVLVSLYMSEIKHHEPCNICWYQRICLFPLAIILWIATYRRDYSIGLYLLPQLFVGLILSLYQIALQEIPGWNPIEMCGAGPSCSEKIAIGLGPLSMPMLAAALFLFLILLLLIVWKRGARSTQTSIHPPVDHSY